MKKQKKVWYAESKITLNGICKPTRDSVYSILLSIYCPHTWRGFDFGLSHVLQETVMSLSISVFQHVLPHPDVTDCYNIATK
jgi:hypothetical protein